VGTDKRARQKANRELARQAQVRRQKFDKARRRGLIYGVGIPVAVVALFMVSRLGGSGSSSTTQDTTPAPLTTLPGQAYNHSTPCPKPNGVEERATSFKKAPPMCIDTKKTYTATFDTTEGKIVVALDTKKTPNTVNNFVVLSWYGYYDTSYIFRTDVNLDIIQGGGASNTDSPGYTIKDEGSGFTYKPGDLVMARSAAPDSGGGQFFFVTGPKASVLDSQGNYVVFGKITKGLEVAQAIQALNSGEGQLGGAPSRPVQIKRVIITES
jgi:cyclophilin family peptidyl-prolyl cis-trans isomerase